MSVSMIPHEIYSNSDVQLSLEHMLSLACGTPEIGAVNFNYLHEVIYAILKHLGINNKVTNVTANGDLRNMDERWTSGYGTHPLGDFDEEEDENKAFDELVEELETESIAAAPPKDDDNNAVVHHEGGSVPPQDASRPSSAKSRPKSGKSDKSNSSRPATAPKESSRPPSSAESNQRPKSSEKRARFPSDSKTPEAVATESNNGETTNRPATKESGRNSPGEQRTESPAMSDKSGASPVPPSRTRSKTMPSSEDKSETEEETKSGGNPNGPHHKRISVAHSKRSVANRPEPPISAKRLSILKLSSDADIMLVNKSLEMKDSKTRASDMMNTLNVNRRLEATEATLQGITSIIDAMSDEIEAVKNANTLDPDMIKKIATKLKGVDGRVSDLEKNCATKDDLKNFTDNDALNALLKAINDQIADQSKLLSDLQDYAKSIHDETRALSSQFDENQNGSKNFASQIRALEKTMEDLASSLAKCQEDLAKALLNGGGLDDDSIMVLRNNVFDLQESRRKMQDHIDQLMQEMRSKSNKMKEYDEAIKILQDTKADKEWVDKLMEDKATIEMLENYLTRDQFDEVIGGLDQSLQDLMQKMLNQEQVTQEGLDKLYASLQEKLNSAEFYKLKEWMENKFRKIEKQIKPRGDQEKIDESAAGSRKKLNPYNCISCNRDCEVAVMPRGPALPYNGPLPATKLRHHATIELRQIFNGSPGGNRERFDAGQEKEKLQRELLRLWKNPDRLKLQKELLKMCGVRDFEELSAQTNRACGGMHTLVEQSNRSPASKIPGYLKDNGSPIPTSGEKQVLETNVLGRDGHIYKGRMETHANTSKDNMSTPRGSPEHFESEDIVPINMKISPHPPLSISIEEGRPGSPIKARPSSVQNNQAHSLPAIETK